MPVIGTRNVRVESEADIKIYLDMRSYFSLGRQFVVGLCKPIRPVPRQ